MIYMLHFHSHRFFKTYGLLIARVFLGGMFFLAGVSKLIDVPGTTLYFSSADLPAPMFLALTIGILEVLSGGAVIIGRQIERAALLLILITLLITFALYGSSTWVAQPLKHLVFLNNFAIVGGLLFVVAHGVGDSWSLGRRRKVTTNS